MKKRDLPDVKIPWETLEMGSTKSCDIHEMIDISGAPVKHMSNTCICLLGSM